MTIEEAVGYYHSLLRFGMKPGLSRIRALCRLLGDSQEKLRCIHIAGTNGKGSVAVMLSEIFQAAGYITGLFTSPYITCFQERIQINGAPVKDDVLIAATEQVKRAALLLEHTEEPATEFEAVTAAAFLIFAKENCDIVILETGLGGRFDATNCISSPLLSIITSISLDHTGVLGGTLEQIAFEKSGIIKPERPLLCPDTISPSALAVIRETCRKRSAPMITIQKQDITVANESLTGFDETYQGLSFHVPLPAAVQSENAALAVQAAKHCAGYSVPDRAICHGIAQTRNPARCELLSKEPLILLDGCHNDASTAALAALLQQHLNGKKILAVLGMMADKDIDKALLHLLPCFSFVITTTPSNPRAIAADALCRKISDGGTCAEKEDQPSQAIERALAMLPSFDALVICGSLYLAGDVRQYLQGRIHDLFAKGG